MLKRLRQQNALLFDSLTLAGFVVAAFAAYPLADGLGGGGAVVAIIVLAAICAVLVASQ